MRVAAIERFPDPSRRCDPERVAGAGDEVMTVWDLARDPARDPAAPVLKWSHLLRVVPQWLTLPLPLRARWELLRRCARMNGWRRDAFERVPALARSLIEQDIDEIACYSTKGFEVAEWFAQRTGRPAREMLGRGTKYFGEFAFELLAVIPYAHWLHEHGRLEYTISTPDTRCLYYFSPDHTEVAIDRSYVPITEYPIGEIGERSFDRAGFPVALDTTQWSPPPYRDVFANDGRFRWAKPPVVVCNKANDEACSGAGSPPNSLDRDVLFAVISRLRPRFTVIYNRPRAQDIVGDHDPIRERGDIEAVRHAFPDVVIIQDLHEQHPDLTFNELQLRVFATSEHFVSVLGGSSYLASYFGGTNVVYAERGWEVACGAYDGWFEQFSNARVVAAATPGELLHAVAHELLADGA